MIVGQANGGDRFAWCLSPSATRPDCRVDAPDFDTAADVLLGGWQILPVTLPRIAQCSGSAVTTLLERASARMIADGAAHDIQMHVLKRLAARLQRRSIKFVLLKSAAMRLIAYDSPAERHARDIDMAVAPQDLPGTIEALTECGFIPAQWREDLQGFEVAEPGLRTRVESEHYELGFWVRVQEVPDLDADRRAAVLAQRDERPAQWEIEDGEELATYVVVDVHHGLSLDIPVEGIIESAGTAELDGVELPVPRDGWLLFHLVYKIYVEGAFNYREGAYQYADLCRLLPKLADAEIAFFLDLVERYKLEAAGYYVLRRLPHHFGIALPAALTAALTDWSVPDWTSTPNSQNDWGDMWPKLWGMR